MTNTSTKPLKHPQEFDALCDDAKTRIVEMSVDDVETLMNERDDINVIISGVSSRPPTD